MIQGHGDALSECVADVGLLDAYVVMRACVRRVLFCCLW
jgi:hypothetical protein